MRTTTWHITMSLDGYIAGPDDAMDWAFSAGGPNPIAEEVKDNTGAILAGRRWYDVASRKYDGVRGIYGGAWTGPVFVITHRLSDAPDDPTVTFLSGDVRSAVATAREAAGDRGVGIFGANTARQCLDAGLLDEIVIHLAPVLLGDGVRLYGGPGMRSVELERTAVAESGQVTDLRFRVR
jgi:dihydrofolate reductase